MKSFILWGTSYKPEKFELSFFASRASMHRIEGGSEQMMMQMMTDLGVDSPVILDWETSLFLTNYLKDEGDEGSWEDLWNESWQITVYLNCRS